MFFQSSSSHLGGDQGPVVITGMGGKILLYPIDPGALPFMVGCFVDVLSRLLLI